jgi:hypothetical protein
LSAASLTKYLYLAYLSKPVADRVIYRKIQKLRAGHLVGIGLGDGDRARKMIQLAARCSRRRQVQFTGIDLFELRPASLPRLSLKAAHRLLSPLGASVKLVPGDPFSALATTANSLLDTDLVVIGADQDRVSIERAWFYVPRMLHTESLVLVEEPDTEDQRGSYRILDFSAVEQLARLQTPPRRAA